MNIQKVIIGLVLLFMIHPTSFAMKRQGDDIQTLDTLHQNKKPAVLSRREYIAEIFEYSTWGLSMGILKNNSGIEKLSAYDKIAHLNQCDKRQRVEIDKAQAQRMAVLRTLPAQEARAIIKNDFQQIHKRLHQREIEAQNALIQAYNIDTTSLAWRFDALDARDKVNNSVALLRKPNNTTTWSINLSPKMAMSLERSMKEYGIEPTSVNVIDMEEKYLTRGSRGTYKSSRQKYVADKDIKSFAELEEYENNPQKNLYQYVQTTPGCFSFNPGNVEKTNEHLTFIGNHELTHALKGHSQAQASLLWNIVQHAPVKTSVKEIYAHTNFAQWLLTQETMADTLLALQNPYAARCAFKHCNYPNSYGYLKVMNDDLDHLQYLDAKAARENISSSNPSKTTLRIKLSKKA